MKTMDPSLRLSLAFGLLLAILIGIGYLGLSRTEGINANREEILGRRWHKVQLAREALGYSTLNNRITMEVFLVRDPAQIAQLLRTRRENTESISQLVAKIDSQCESEEERKLLAYVAQARRPYVSSYERALKELLEDRDHGRAMQTMVQQTLPALKIYHEAWNGFVRHQTDQIELAATDSRSRYANTRKLMLALIVLAVLAAAATAIFAVTTIVEEITARRAAEKTLTELNAELERRVEDRTEELSLANADLKQREEQSRHLAEALRPSEERFQQISNHIDQVFYLASIDSGRIAYISPGFKKMFGRSWQLSARATGLWLEAVIPECREQILASHRRLVAGEAIQEEYQIVRPDGSSRWIKHHANPIRDGQDKVAKYAGVLEDITEAHEAREALQQSEEKYRSLVRNLPDVVWSVDSQKRVVFISPNIEQFLGYSAEELYQRGARVWFESIHPDDAAKVSDAFEALFAKGQPYDVECRVRRKDGKWIWAHDRAIVTYERNGLLHADGVVSDITARKQAAEELRSQTAFLEAISNSTIDGILVVDDENQKLLQNQHLMRMLKVPQHILDEKDDMIMRQDVAARIKDPEQFLRQIARLHEDRGQTIHDELEFKDGTILDRCSAPVIGKDGKYYGRIWTFRDITERRRDEHALRQLSQAVEQSPASIHPLPDQTLRGTESEAGAQCLPDAIPIGDRREGVAGKHPDGKHQGAHRCAQPRQPGRLRAFQANRPIRAAHGRRAAPAGAVEV